MLLALIGISVFVAIKVYKSCRKKSKGRLLSFFGAFGVTGLFLIASIVVLAHLFPSPSQIAKSNEKTAEQSVETPSRENEKIKVEEPEVVEPTPNEPLVPLLGYDSEEFRKRFNEAGKRIQTKLSCEELVLSEGAVNDSFTVNLSKTIALVGTIDKKSKNLKTVTLIGAGDGTQESGFLILQGIGQFIATTAPELDSDGRGKLLEDMGFGASRLQEGSQGSYVMGTRKFFYSFSSMTGLWFGVEAVE